jgi:iron complex transport system ATP-binding protein
MTLIAEDVSVTLGRREVLGNLSFQARRGELLIVVGPNGAGKTTLLKAIACLVAHRGRLDWDGVAVGKLSAAARARTMAYLPQGHVAHWPLKARDVVTMGRAPFASSFSRLSRADRDAVDAAIESVGAAAFAARPITELSGGERARIMLARALSVGAPLLLADEPVASLDPAHQLAVMAILAAQATAGRLILAVSHDLMLAARFADRILVLSGGKAAAIGAPAQTLTAAILRDIFEVEPLRLSAAGVSLEIPWQPAGAKG